MRKTLEEDMMHRMNYYYFIDKSFISVFE